MNLSKKWLWLVFFFIYCYAASSFAQDENSCLVCHRELPYDTFVGENYLKWQSSVHSRAGITCDRCHAGNPAQKELPAAHLGVLNSGQPQSKVYFKNVPRTCGSCHTQEYKAFRTSIHYRELEEKGEGPTCVSCHGSKAAAIVTPEQLVQICVRCHNSQKQIDPAVPTQAYNALYLLSVAQEMLSWGDELLRNSGSKNEKVVAEPYLAAAKNSFARAQNSWHAFDLELETSLTQATLENLKKMKRALE